MSIRVWVFDSELWEPFISSNSWTMSAEGGQKTVYVKYKDDAGQTSNAYSDSITIDQTAASGSITINSVVKLKLLQPRLLCH